MFERYDIYSVFDFYKNLGTKITELANYCILNFEDEKLINEIIGIEKEYKSLVMKEFEDRYFN